MNYLAKIFVLFLIAFIQNVAAENWLKLGSSFDGVTSVYIDTETIKKDEGFVYYWSLDDYTESLEGANALSVMGRFKADCDLDRQQALNLFFFSENMGLGEPKLYGPNKEWTYPPPGSVGKKAFDFACSYNN